VLNVVGPVVAIGRPGEPMPGVPHEKWTGG
jgi:hypothetical protein